MAGTDPFARLLKATGDRLGEVLDSYKQFYPHVLSSDYHQVIKNVKALLELVQLLENEYLIRPSRTAIPRAETNISQVLKDCGELSKLLRIQIEGRRLRDDVSTSEDIERYYSEVESFRHSYGRSRDEPTARAARAEHAELEDLRRQVEEGQREITRLRTIIAEQAEQADQFRDESYEGSTPECCRAKLSHIKCLHEEIACLGMLHRRQHGLNSWEELSGELPHMVDHIKGIDKQLKRLRDPESPTPTPTPTQASAAHRRNHSEPQNVRPRQPSPTGSNISVSRDSASTVRNESRRRSSRGPGYFSNQRDWRW